jgi:integrase
MAVYDRWHKSRPRPGDELCREHKMAPTADHGVGDRWQVRYRDEAGVQRKRNFARKTGGDPERSADAFDAKVRTQLDDGSYVDPAAGTVSFRAYAEQWRAGRAHDPVTARRIEGQLRNHVYASPETPGRTPMGGPALGGHQLRILARQPSIVQEWIKGIPLSANSARLVIRDVGQVFAAAIDDGLIGRDPLRAKSVTKPKAVKREAVPWTIDQVDAMRAALPPRLAELADLGAACGMRQGELFAAALEELDFLRMTVHVGVQLKRVDGVTVFAPTKSKARDVPVAAPVIPRLSEHVRLYRPVAVTLPWHEPGARRHGKLVTRTLLFTTPAGGPLARGRFNEQWGIARKAAGIPDEPGNGCHVVRHTAASVWLSQGVSLAKVAAYLGDTKEVVLATYAHFLPSDDDRARDAMNAFFSGSCAPDVPREAQNA